MKKLLVLFVSSLIMAGCTPTGQKQVVSPPTTPTPTESNIITNIKDAVTKNLVLKCEYTDEDGAKTTTYIQGSSVRMIGADEETQNINGLIKDKKFYVWELGGKEGMVMDMTKIEESNPLKMGDTPVKNEEDIIAVLEEQKNNCSISPVDASMLELPKDVEFKEFGGW